MIRLTVLYPATPGSTFDWDYYLGPHVELARKLMTPCGLLKIEIEKGAMGMPPGAPAPYHAIAHLYFNTMEELGSALQAAAPELIADQAKYAGAGSVLQIGELLDV